MGTGGHILGTVTAPSATIPAGLTIGDATVDLLVVGSGTGWNSTN